MIVSRQPPQAEAPAAPAAITATGCLARSDDGVFQLTAENAVYALTPASDDVDLTAHVGHSITVNGTVNGTVNAPAAAPAAPPE